MTSVASPHLSPAHSLAHINFWTVHPSVQLPQTFTSEIQFPKNNRGLIFVQA